MSFFGSFLPPAVIEIQAIAGEAIAKMQEVNTELGMMEGHAVAASGALSGLERAAMLGKAVLLGLGVAAVGVGVMSVHAAMTAEEAYSRLGQAMANAGVNTEKNRAQAEAMFETMTRLGFKHAESAATLGTLITATGSFTKATDMMGIAADLARYKHMDLNTAAVILARGTQGSARAFKELGITLDTHIPKNLAIKKAFDELQKKIHDQAIVYSKTFRGEMEALGAEFDSVAEKLGAWLIPKLTDFLGWVKTGIDWVSKHTAVLYVFAAAVAPLVIAALVNMANEMKAFVVETLIANWEITLFVAAVALIAIAFAKAWNAFSGFQNAVIDGMKFINTAFYALVMAAIALGKVLYKVLWDPIALVLQALAHIPNPFQNFAKSALKTGNDIEAGFDKSIRSVRGLIEPTNAWFDTLKGKKIDVGWNMNLPDVKIPPNVQKQINDLKAIFGDVPGGSVGKAGGAGSQKYVPGTEAWFKHEAGSTTYIYNVTTNAHTNASPKLIADSTVAAIKFGTPHTIIVPKAIPGKVKK